LLELIAAVEELRATDAARTEDVAAALLELIAAALDEVILALELATT
jgi:hypothetical protein